MYEYFYPNILNRFSNNFKFQISQIQFNFELRTTFNDYKIRVYNIIKLDTFPFEKLICYMYKTEREFNDFVARLTN